MKWLISEIIDVDGGFGDAIPIESPLCIVEGTEEEIEEYCNKYNMPTVYAIPYDQLYCGRLKYSKLPEEGSLDKSPFSKERLETILDYQNQPLKYLGIDYEEEDFDEEYGGEWYDENDNEI